MMESKRLVVLCGPTATGKTALAVELAKRLGGEIVSADSMQVYRGMDIGTAKPTLEDRQGIPHHMLDMIDPGESYSVQLYQQQARRCIEEITARGHLPILCGGTGLYINAVVYPLDFTDQPPDPNQRQQWAALAEREGPKALHRLLEARSPALAAEIHPNNVKRVIRALEAQPAGAARTVFAREPLYRLAWLGLRAANRDGLYARIDQRVDRMMDQGLLDEVRSLAKGTLSQTAAQAIGYKEILAHLNGTVSLSEAVEEIKRGSRRYAKRQMTWFRREPAIHWMDIDAASIVALVDAALGYIRPALGIE